MSKHIWCYTISDSKLINVHVWKMTITDCQPSQKSIKQNMDFKQYVSLYKSNATFDSLFIQFYKYSYI